MVVLWVVLGCLVVGGLVLVWLRRRRVRPPGVPAEITRVYTTHAKERMVLRGISQDDVEETLAAPHRVEQVPREGSVRFEREEANRLLKVWVVADPWPPQDKVVVKTTAANYFAVLVIPKRAVGRVIGRGGSVIQDLQGRTNASIRVDRAKSTVHIRADEREQVLLAQELVRAVARGRR